MKILESFKKALTILAISLLVLQPLFTIATPVFAATETPTITVSGSPATVLSGAVVPADFTYTITNTTSTSYNISYWWMQIFNINKSGIKTFNYVEGSTVTPIAIPSDVCTYYPTSCRVEIFNLPVNTPTLDVGETVSFHFQIAFNNVSPTVPETHGIFLGAVQAPQTVFSNTSASFTVNNAAYTLTYTAGPNGSIAGISPQSVNSLADGATVTAVADAGYHFTGWSDGVQTAARTDLAVTADISVTANFAVNAYTLTFDSNGGSAVDSITGDYGAVIDPPANPVRDGFSFVGWDSPIPATIPASNLNFMAIWQATNGDTTAPNAPANGEPHNKYLSTNSFDFSWDAVVDVSSPVTYDVQSSLNPAQSEGVLTTDLWKLGELTTNGFHTNSAPDGRWYWQVRATDSVGNIGQWSPIWELVLDTVAPVVDITGPTSTLLKGEVQIRGSVVDNNLSHYYLVIKDTSGEVRAKVDSDGVVYVNDSFTDQLLWNFDSSSLPDGEYSIVLEATDLAGNIGIESVKNFEIINAYTLTYTAGPNGSIAGISPQSVNSLADGATVTAVADAGYHFTGWSDGVQTAARTDLAVTADISVTANFAVNATSPLVADIDFYLGTGPLANGFKVVFNEAVKPDEATNPANYYLTDWPGNGGSGDLIGDATVTYDDISKTATVTFVDAGWYVLPEQLWGVENIHDLAGNLMSVNPLEERSTAMVAPMTSFSESLGTISLISTDDGSGVKTTYYNLDSTGLAQYGGPFSTEDGEHQICYYSDDNAGNVENTVCSSFTTDIQGPSLETLDNITLEATSPDGAVVDYQAPVATDVVDGSVEVVCDPVSGSTFDLGETMVTCTATDSSAHISETTFVITVQDTTAPVIVPNGVTPVIVRGGTYTERGATATDIVDGAFAATPSGTVNTNILGSYVITYNAIDEAGNTAIPVTRTVKVVAAPISSRPTPPTPPRPPRSPSPPTAPTAPKAPSGSGVLGSATTSEVAAPSKNVQYVQGAKDKEGYKQNRLTRFFGYTVLGVQTWTWIILLALGLWALWYFGYRSRSVKDK